jgi:type I restriction enzyme, S subunit
MITGAYTIFECPNPLLAAFLDLFYRSMDDRKLLSPLYSGLRNTIPPARFLGTKTPVPPPPEQAAIVRFLEWANGRIKKAIRAKQKSITLLNEQKQAIIQRAVTRGLDSFVALKTSGISWLGDIPRHWEVLPVKRCSSVISKGTTPSTEGREILESGPIRFLKAENISGGRITSKPLAFIDQETHRVLRRSELHQGDVLFVIAGATLGKTAVVENEHLPANTNQAVAFIRPNSRVLPEFLLFWLQSPRIKEQTWLNAVQSAQPNLSMASLGMFSVPLPPRHEQEIVIDGIKRDTYRLNAAIKRLEEEIDLLREYRTRLVADVVTGKLDVRNVEIPLDKVSADAEPRADGEEVEGDEIDVVEENVYADN